MNRFSIAFSLTASLVGSFMAGSPADAQIRIGRFGGVSVRVPFVGVDVLPFGGGTRVVAPFTSVNTGLYGGGFYGGGFYERGLYGGGSYGVGPYDGYRSYYGPRDYLYDHPAILPFGAAAYGSPIYGVPDYAGYRYGGLPYGGLGYGVIDDRGPDYRVLDPREISDPEIYADDRYRAAYPSAPADQVSSSTLVSDLRFAASRLSRGLAQRRDDADVWQDYLKPDLIIETIDDGGSPSDLQTLLLNYEGLSGNAQLSNIWTVDGFRQTHQLLRQWVELSVPTPDATPVGAASIRKASQDLPAPRPTTTPRPTTSL